MIPVAPPHLMWSIRFLPSSPLELASPSGYSGVAELNRIRVDSSAEAQSKIVRARTSNVFSVRASMTRTPSTRFDAAL